MNPVPCALSILPPEPLQQRRQSLMLMHPPQSLWNMLTLIKASTKHKDHDWSPHSDGSGDYVAKAFEGGVPWPAPGLYWISFLPIMVLKQKCTSCILFEKMSLSKSFMLPV